MAPGAVWTDEEQRRSRSQEPGATPLLQTAKAKPSPPSWSSQLLLLFTNVIRALSMQTKGPEQRLQVTYAEVQSGKII